MKDGSIDAFFWSGGLPTGAVTDLTTTDKITMLDTTVYTDKLVQKYGDVYRDETIPKGTYKGVDKDVPTIAVPNYLVVSEKMDDKLAHDLTKLLFDQKQDLVAVHPEAEEPRPGARQGGDRADRAPPRGEADTSTRKVRRPLIVAALAGALLAAGCGERTVVVRDDGGRVLVEARAARVGALRARVPPLLLPGPGARGVPRRRAPASAWSRSARPARRCSTTTRSRAPSGSAPGRRSRPRGPQRFERLPLIATATGRRTLAVDGRRYPLYGAAPRHLTIAVEEGTWP